MATSRRRIFGYIAMALSAGLGATAGAVLTTPVQAQTRTTTAEVRVATYNIRAGLDNEVAAKDVARLALQTDIIALQEMGSRARRALVKELVVDCSMCPLQGYMPDGPGVAATPILYRWEKFRFEDSGTTQVSEATYVGPKGAGPSTLSAKYINWVKLRERLTGRDVYVLNNHTVPTVEGKYGQPKWEMKERLDLYRQHMEGLGALVRQFSADGSLVLVTGDLNVNFRADRRARHPLFPYSRMGKVGLKASYEHLGEPASGSHRLSSGNDRRLIDYVYSPTTRKLRAASQRVLTGYSSDHRPVVVTYKMR